MSRWENTGWVCSIPALTTNPNSTTTHPTCTTPPPALPRQDASVVTLNLNLNAPGEGFGGSSLEFINERNASVKHEVDFEAGHAIIHQGALRHSAQPIESGERQNLIVWLFGRDGDVR